MVCRLHVARGCCGNGHRLDAIRDEVMAKIPFLLETSGYFPSVDHFVPPDVPFENFVYFINTMREVAGLSPLKR